MDEVFKKNQINQNDENFEYEKNVEFKPDESNDWDDSESDF